MIVPKALAGEEHLEGIGQSYVVPFPGLNALGGAWPLCLELKGDRKAYAGSTRLSLATDMAAPDGTVSGADRRKGGKIYSPGPCEHPDKEAAPHGPELESAVVRTRGLPTKASAATRPTSR